MDGGQQIYVKGSVGVFNGLVYSVVRTTLALFKGKSDDQKQGANRKINRVARFTSSRNSKRAFSINDQ